MTQQTMYAKQPIFNRELTVVGYELLFRPSEDIANIDGDKATAQVILNVFTSDDPLIDDHSLSIYINCTAAWLKTGLPIKRPNLVLEVLENIQDAESLIEPVRLLKKQGYQIALDDFDSTLGIACLMPQADIVKVDVLALPKTDIETLVENIKQQGKIALAEKVETQAVYTWCAKLGFDCFQGYFFSKPKLNIGNSVQPSKISTLQLVTELQAPMPDIQNIVSSLQTDTILTTKLLKLVNGGNYVQVRTVNSLKDAVVILGLTQLKKIVAMVALTELSNKPHELMRLNLVIAHAMETYAKLNNIENTDEWFFIGFLSMIDAQFDQAMESILNSLPISPHVKESLLTRSSQEGLTLRLIEAMITGNWDYLSTLENTDREIFDTILIAEQETENFLSTMREL